MNNYLKLEINSLKNINNLKLEIPLEKGLYAIVGKNGSGKSTLMLVLSQLVKRSSLAKLTKYDYNNESFIKFTYNEIEDTWVYRTDFEKWRVKDHAPLIQFDGFYEGSIFYGTRFSDASIAEEVLPTLIDKDCIVDADKFIIEKLSMILHGDNDYYKGLKRIRNRDIANQYGFKGMPYFYDTGRGLISQLAMSSGECMLITLLHDVYNILIRKNYKKGEKIIFLIDEVELALHPSAINRFVNFMQDLIKQYELITIFSSHSAEIIRRISPKNMFEIENNNGNIEITNPCYPSYAIRDIYTQDGFDYLVLVEDELAKKFVDKIILENNLSGSKLLYVLPVGGWSNNLKLHNDIIENNILGLGKSVISILDGDAIEEVNKRVEYKNLTKLFLPIKSIEKYLYSKLIVEDNRKFIKFLGDKYFRVRSITEILNDYKSNFKIEDDTNGKKLYKVLTSNLFRNGIGEESFKDYFCQDLLKMIDTSKFVEKLKILISSDR